MPLGRIQNAVLQYLETHASDGPLPESRDIAEAIYQTGRAVPEQVARVRQALRSLERHGFVTRHGFWAAEWQIKKSRRQA